MDTYSIDGKLVPPSKAVIPITDLAVLRGYGVFDFLRTYGAQPFYLDDHIDRLRNSAKLVGIDIPWSRTFIVEAVEKTLAKSRHKESNIRIVITGGESSDFITPNGAPRLLVIVTKVVPFPAAWYSECVDIVTLPVERAIPGAKSIDYICAIMALKTAKRRKAVEAVYRDRDNLVREGTTSNLFVFLDDQLITPAVEDILPGVTRKVVLELCSKAFDAQVGNITLDELYRADEVFLTSSTKEVLPVGRVDGNRIRDGKPGKNTLRVMELFARHTAEYAASCASSEKTKASSNSGKAKT